MNHPGRYALVVAGLSILAIASAPVASAQKTCHDAGSVIRCETSGSVSLKATPEPRAPHVGQINGDRTVRRGISWSW
jgi:hypothetical protein